MQASLSRMLHADEHENEDGMDDDDGDDDGEPLYIPGPCFYIKLVFSINIYCKTPAFYVLHPLFIY